MPLYDVDLRPGVLYITELGKFFARVHISTLIGYDEYIPAPPPDDIDTNFNADGGTIHFLLRPVGTPLSARERYGTLLAEILPGTKNPGDQLDIADVKQAIGDKVFIVNIDIAINNPPPTQSGEISKDSQIEIYE
jgi:hypothetical protein